MKHKLFFTTLLFILTICLTSPVTAFANSCTDSSIEYSENDIMPIDDGAYSYRP